MRTWCSAFAWLLLAGVAPVRAQTSAAPPGWQLDPSISLLGSLDQSTDVPSGSSFTRLEEPHATANVGASLDFSHDVPHGWLKGSVFALARSPYSDHDRTFFGAGVLEASRSLGARGRLTVTDDTKAQVRAREDVSDYWSNVATLHAEWNRPSGGGFELELADRRRSLPDLEFLGFSLQAVGGGAFFPLGEKGRARLGAQLQRYSATTADGGRAAFEAELARFTRNGIASLRLAWFAPFADHRRAPPTSGEPGEPYDFGDIGRSEFFEALTFRSASLAMRGGSAFLDPLESESDQWDFGRRKLVLAGFASRRFGTLTTASVFIRFQHKRGPNLLLPSGVPAADSFTDDRLEARVAAAYQLRQRVSLVMQSSYLQNWSTRQPLDFRRFLVAFGVQIHF